MTTRNDDLDRELAALGIVEGDYPDDGTVEITTLAPEEAIGKALDVSARTISEDLRDLNPVQIRGERRGRPWGNSGGRKDDDEGRP